MKNQDKLYEIQPMSALCSLEIFKIKGVDVEYTDRHKFYDNDDVDCCNAEPYGCGYMKGFAQKASTEMLKKYDITVEEFNEIAEAAADAVTFGRCGWCV